MKKRPSIENRIYAALIGICEGRESNGSYRGNGHHLAQELTKAVSVALLPLKKKKIYDALPKIPTRVKEIAKIVKMPSNIVAAQLGEINKTTLLIGYKKQGKYKLWSRN